MKTIPKLVQILNPPTITTTSGGGGTNHHDMNVVASLVTTTTTTTTTKSNNNNNDNNNADPTTTTAKMIVNKALSVSLAQNRPTATSSSSTSTSSSTIPFRVQLITVHPCQPIVAYLLIPTTTTSSVSSSSGIGGDGINSNTTTSSFSGTSNLLQQVPTMIIVQHVRTKQILFRISLGEIVSNIIYKNNNNNGTMDNNNYDNTKLQHAKQLKDWGTVQRIDFMDPSTLYWAGYVSGGDRSENTTKRGTTTDSSTTSPSQQPRKRWRYLIVQFQNRIVLLNIMNHQQHGLGLLVPSSRNNNNSSNNKTTTIHNNNNRTTTTNLIVADINPSLLLGGGTMISSNVIPVSETSIIVGCVDGTIKVYDWESNIILSSVSMQTWYQQQQMMTTTNTTSSKNDYIVEIISTNPFAYSPDELYTNNDKYDGTIGGSKSTTTTTSSSSSTSFRPRTIICISRKGGAYLCPLIVGPSSVNGAVVVKDIGIPFIKLEGGAVPSTINMFKKQQDDNDQQQQSSSSGGSGGSTSMDYTLIHYDRQRDLFLWLVPSKTKSKLLVWDLSTYIRMLSNNNNNNNNTTTNRPNTADPILIVQFPLDSISHTVYPGWTHECVPKDSMACIVVTKDGDLYIFVAPLYNSGSTIKHPFQAVLITKSYLPNIVRRDLELGTTGDDVTTTTTSSSQQQPNFKVQSIHCPALRDTSTLSIGTTIGIIQIRLMNIIPFIPNGTMIVHMSANIGTMGKAVLCVRGSQVSYIPLDTTTMTTTKAITNSGNNATASGGGGGPIGRILSDFGPVSGTTGGTTASASTTIGGGGIGSGNIINPNNNSRDRSVIVYESPPPLHLPAEIHKRPVRLPPVFLPSPSKNFVCCFWKEEMRYEILSISILLDRVTSRTTNLVSGPTPLVASGNGTSSFAWVGDDDVYCLLYDPEQDLALKVGIDLSSTSNTADIGSFADLTKVKELKKLKELARLKTYKRGVKSMVGTAGKLKSLEGIRDLGKDTGKLGMGAVKLTGKLGLGTVKLTGKVALGVTQGAVKETSKIGMGATKNVTKMAVGGTMKGANKVKKIATFGMWKKKSQDKRGEGSLANSEIDDEDDDVATSTTTTAPIVPMADFDQEADEMAISEQLERKFPWVELRVLVGTSAGSDGTVTNWTASNLGQLSLRIGNRNPPTVLFGGPVLCVGSKLDESDEGLAYFYTKKKVQEEESASIYVSSGPAFPCPDIVVWDDDGRLCAVIIQGRVSIYLSEEPNFVMLGTTKIGSPSDVNGEVISCRFIHGVLFCTTRSSVQCIFLGDLEGGVCHLDSFILASSDVPTFPSRTIVTDYRSLTPPIIPMPLNHPEILGFQSGSLILSTVSGVVALPLGSPLLRIGTLISAGSEHHAKAERWFNAVPNCDHEVLATFLERRGVPEMALNLPGISLETIIDMSMRFGYVDKLEEVVEMHGLEGLRAIDMSRGFSANIFGPEEYGTSLVVCVGAYLLSFGRVELVRRLATECLASGEEGKQEAFLLASLLLSVNFNDAKRVLQRSVDNVDERDWLVGSFVRNHVLGNTPN